MSISQLFHSPTAGAPSLMFGQDVELAEKKMITEVGGQVAERRFVLDELVVPAFGDLIENRRGRLESCAWYRAANVALPSPAVLSPIA